MPARAAECGKELHGPAAIEVIGTLRGRCRTQNGRVKAASPTPAERRSGKDRRQREDAPPGGRERRRGIEPRRPEVIEVDITPSQWDALQDAAFPVPAPAAPPAKR